MAVDVFIIHASTDKPSARRLHKALLKQGITVFFDETNLEGGDVWDERIAHELKHSLLQVVLLGKAERWYQSEEVARAITRMRELGADDRVVPVLLEPRDELPYGLSRVHAQTWEGPEAVSARLTKRVAELRGAAAGTPSQRVRVAITGLWQEMPELFERLHARISQRTAMLEGPVAKVDLTREASPPCDAQLLVLGSRHCGKLSALRELVNAAGADSQPSTGTVLAAALEIRFAKLPKEQRDEAREVQDELHDRLRIHESHAELIDDLDQRFAEWFVATHHSKPGESAVRTPWEERYLKDKMPLWRRGDPSAMRNLGNAQAERVQWYVHLKAARPWCEVAGAVRYSVKHTVLDNGYAPDRRVRVVPPTQPAPPSHLWYSCLPSGYDDGPPWKDDFHEQAFGTHAPRDAWLDSVLSLADVPRCVVVGQAGSGKSVLLQHIAWALSGGAEHRPGQTDHYVDLAAARGNSAVDPLPILHNATTVVAHLRHAGAVRPIREALVELLRSSDTFGDEADSASLRAGIDAGRYVFLIDSLDEVPSRRDREALVTALGALDGRAPRVILTTRPSAHTAVELPAGFARVDIAPLDEETADRLVRAWVHTWAPHEDLETVRAAVKMVRDSFPTNTAEQSPVENPLLLGSLLQVYATYHRLPDDTAKLYSDMVRTLCEAKVRATEESQRDSMVSQYREALRELFLAAQERGGTVLSAQDAREILVERRLAPRDSADNWLHALANHTGLIRFEGQGDHTVLRPWHRSFQEYLAAEAIVLRFAHQATECVRWLRAPRTDKKPRFEDASWVGLLRFLVGAAVHQNRAWGVALIEALASEAELPSPEQSHLWSVACFSAAEYNQAYFANEEVVADLPRRVVASFDAHGTTWPLADRIETFDAVGRLGDPRLPDPRTVSDFCHATGWVFVEDGEYVVGAAPPEGPLDLDPVALATTTTFRCPGFWIRRWPVTNAEFLEFCRDTMETERAASPGRKAFMLHMNSHRRRHPSHPATHVDWLTANRFCAWATSHWKLPIVGELSLPTLAEWEVAASRGGSRRYPWGDDPPVSGPGAQANFAAVRNTSQTTPVGLFRTGDTPDGIWDLTGNVNEWCEHPFAIGATETRAHPPDGNVITRGGGWRTSAEGLEIRQVRRRLAEVSSESVGFRVVLRLRHKP